MLWLSVKRDSQGKTGIKRVAPAAGLMAFSAFMDRDDARRKRGRSRRTTVLVSILIHAVALAFIVVLSMWRVDELFSPSVKVTVFPSATAPPAAVP